MVRMVEAASGSAWESGAIPLGAAHLTEGADEGLSNLVQETGAGVPFDQSFEVYRRVATRSSQLSILPPDGRINWSWLTDLSDTTSAIDLGSPFGEVAAHLALDFREVSYIGAESVHGTAARNHLSQRDRVTPVICRSSHDERARAFRGKMDLVAFVAAPGWRQRLPAELKSPAGIVEYADSVLHPSGWLGILIDNPYWHAALRRTDGARLEAVRTRNGFRRELKRRGFRDTREYLVAHDASIPSVYIPATREAVLRYQVATHARRSHGAAARFGLHAVLFPARLLLATR